MAADAAGLTHRPLAASWSYGKSGVVRKRGEAHHRRCVRTPPFKRACGPIRRWHHQGALRHHVGAACVSAPYLACTRLGIQMRQNGKTALSTVEAAGAAGSGSGRVVRGRPPPSAWQAGQLCIPPRDLASASPRDGSARCKRLDAQRGFKNPTFDGKSVFACRTTLARSCQ